MRRIEPGFVSAVFDLLDLAARTGGVEEIFGEWSKQNPGLRDALRQGIAEGSQTVVATIDRAGLTFLEEQCRQHGFPSAAAKAEKILHDGRGKRRIDLSRYLPDLTERLRAELENVRFFVVKADTAKYYESPEEFGSRALRRFPRAIHDMEEAGNCRALERPTACVFHLMRVMEHALRALGRALKVKDPAGTARRSWAKCIDEMLGKVDAKVAANPNWKKHPHYRFWTNALGLLDTVRLRWRNRCMHVDRTYNEREAARVYEAVCEFADHLAGMPRSIGP
jgi:hypothetical protein